MKNIRQRFTQSPATAKNVRIVPTLNKRGHSDWMTLTCWIPSDAAQLVQNDSFCQRIRAVTEASKSKVHLLGEKYLSERTLT